MTDHATEPEEAPSFTPEELSLLEQENFRMRTSVLEYEKQYLANRVGDLLLENARLKEALNAFASKGTPADWAPDPAPQAGGE